MNIDNSKTILHVSGVDVGYSDKPVIQNINLDVMRGEMFGLIGLNGVGKTTLMKAILGLRAPQKGEIKLFDQDVQLKESRRNLAYLPERFEPPWFLSGMEFVKFSLNIYKKEFKEEDVYRCAEKLALDKDALRRRVQTYSKGMRQKLGLIATILTRCQLLILDEPMSGLDPKARTLVKDLLIEESSHDQTVFICSHILVDLDEICQRIAVLHDSALQFLGPPVDLKVKMNIDNLERAFLQLIEKKAVA